MQSNIYGRTMDQVAGEIEALDLEPIKFKLACKDDGPGWSSEHIERMAVAYKRFLILLARHPNVTIAPTRDIDTVWHTHILDTRKYAADCQRIFGEFLHHYPYLGLRGDQDRQVNAANALHELFVQEFGDRPWTWFGAAIRKGRNAIIERSRRLFRVLKGRRLVSDARREQGVNHLRATGEALRRILR